MKNKLFTLTALLGLLMACNETEQVIPQIEEAPGRVILTSKITGVKTVIKEYNSCEDYFNARCASLTTGGCASLRLQYGCQQGDGHIIITEQWAVNAVVDESANDYTFVVDINFGSGEVEPLPAVKYVFEDHVIMRASQDELVEAGWVIEDDIIFMVLEPTVIEEGRVTYQATQSKELFAKEGETGVKLMHKDYVIKALNFTIKDDII